MWSDKVRVRRGFTLVELLVVIVILGMLMSLTSAAVWNMMKNARVAAMVTEVDQLTTAVNGYKEAQIEYPPSLSQLSLTDRRLAFMRHLQLAYANSSYGITYLSFSNPVSNSQQWGIREKILNTTTGGWGYNYLDESGAIQQLDLNTLDPAEALVFFLGGFPTPIDPSTMAPVAGRRLFGFHKDTDNPLKRDARSFEQTQPLRYRTDLLFQFVEERLIDNDQDGWLEYTPSKYQKGFHSAPYVYFDAQSYNPSVNKSQMRHTGYPRYNDGTASMATKAEELFTEFGLAAPMAAFFDPSGGSNAKPTIWAKNQGFQLICPGLDGQYSAPNGDFSDAMRVSVFPTGFVYASEGSYENQTAYTPAEADNITNLSNKTLEAARNEALQ